MPTDPTGRLGTRYHSLDALRGFALLLGVFYHAAESFESGHWDWAIVDHRPSLLLSFLRFSSHCFRMEIFFLLAGFFARLVILRRGLGAFAWNRLQRVFIPLVVGWIILFPLMAALWIVGAKMSGNYQLIQIPEEARSLPTWQLWIGFLLGGGITRSFNLTHLWFLHQLLVIYVLFGGARLLWLRCSPGERNLEGLDRLLGRAFLSRARFLPFALVSIAWLLLMPGWGVSTPMHSLIPELGPTVLYGFCFTIGWWLHRQEALLPHLSQGWMRSLVVAVIALAASWWFNLWTNALGWGDASEPLRRIVYSTCYAIAMWAFVFGFLGLFLDRVRNESRFWRYTADASYFVYLAHLPLVVALQLWVAPWTVSWILKYLLILTIALPTLILGYHYLARSTCVGQQLNGRRWPFTPWPGSQ